MTIRLNNYGLEDLKKYWRFLVAEILDLERQHGVSSQWIYDKRLIFHELRINCVGTRLLRLVKKDLSYIHRCLENRILSNSFQPADRTHCIRYVLGSPHRLALFSRCHSTRKAGYTRKNNILKLHSLKFIRILCWRFSSACRSASRPFITAVCSR